MWARCSHKLEPLTNVITTKVKFKWNEAEKKHLNRLRGLQPTIFYYLMRILIKNKNTYQWRVPDFGGQSLDTDPILVDIETFAIPLLMYVLIKPI